jgi:PIN domain nuclease of toxin-antitoxin system
MTLLLDTVVLLWWLAGKGPLSTGVTIRLRQLTTRVYVSVATAWEICALERQGLVDFGRPARDCLASELTAHRFEWLPLDHRHVFLAQQLIASDLDPYDRLILAQATIEHLVLVTTNWRMRDKGIETIDAREPDWPTDRRPAVRPPTLAAAALAADAEGTTSDMKGTTTCAESTTADAEDRMSEDECSATDAAATPARARRRMIDEALAKVCAADTTAGSGVSPDSPQDRPLPAWNAFPWGDASDDQRPA